MTTLAKTPMTESVSEQLIVPPVDVFENAEEFRFVADLPGVPTDAVELRLEHDRLTLYAKRGDQLAYRRAFQLPHGVDFSASSAELTQGVLAIRIPKLAARTPRRIEVTAA